MNFKRGDTFQMIGFLGLPTAKIDLTGYAIRCQLRSAAGALIASLTVSIDLAARTFSLSATAAATSLWPIGRVDCDVEFTDPLSTVRSTQTFRLNIVEGITR